MSMHTITKSLYSAGLQCKKRLYQLVQEPSTSTAPTDDVQLRFRQGQDVGELAREQFLDGVLIEASGSAIHHAIETTQRLIDELAVPAIFEAAIQYEDLLIRVDILQNNTDGSWDLIEVKSTTEVKPEHLEDVAFQLYVLRKAGIDIRRVMLSHINRDVRYPNLEEFFLHHDLTEGAFAHLPQVEANTQELRQVLQEMEAPEVKIGRQCNKPYGCEFKNACWANVPKGSTLELYNYRKRKPTKFELYHQGPKLIQDLQDEVQLTPFQQIQFLASTSEGPIIDQKGLTDFLNQVQYPIYYFDFETIAPPIPILPRMRPYQRIAVQYSCHIQDAPNAELVHREFIATGQPGSDPRLECIEAMQEIFGDRGTIIAYHDDFERSLMRELAQAFPESSDFLLDLESRFLDLEDAFHQFYYHRNFGGSVSIKKVLPYFDPEMKYEDLEIKNGGQAQAALFKLFSPGLSDSDREEIRRDLLTYCAQDSLAMVVIHHKLLEATARHLTLVRPQPERAPMLSV